MTLSFRAAVLHEVRTPLKVETITAGALKPGDVLVRVQAAGLCHTDLEVIEGSLRYPMPIVLGHEASGAVEEVGAEVKGVAPNGPKVGDHVILSWNPHCGHCFYCDRDLPILCETYLAHGPQAVAFDGESRIALGDGGDLRQLMFLGAFGEYCVVPAEQAIVVPRELPFDRACLIGCGVMTGVGGALNVASIEHGGVAMVIGCGAVGLSAVQGARLAGAGEIIAVDLDDAKLALAAKMGATTLVNAKRDDAVAVGKAKSGGRGVDTVLEAAGSPTGFGLSVEAVRPGGEVIWLGKTDVAAEVGFRWGALMGEKHIRRSSYGGARPARDFPMLARAYLDGRLYLDELITRRIGLDEINAGFAALKAGEAIRSVVVF
ncbi:MAG TPA: Zn-dependent alcohol dehydrogenase [Stellaceae bacterium]|jgi:S-(hydroxymethyl)glutathione dehydrogenase/alcohol dehydrogenase|nr:Zn-dependent alcohol dehydrogenase [Stellaceae bacterium]